MLETFGGISPKGATRLVMFTGIMDAYGLGAVYEAGLLPRSLRKHSLMDIGCTKTMIPSMTANISRNCWMTEMSLDDTLPRNFWILTPLSWCGGSLKQFHRNQYKPKN